MAYTDQQITDFAQQMRDKNADPDTIRDFVYKAKAEQASIDQPKGLLRTLGESIIRPAAEVGVSTYNVARSIGGLAAGQPGAAGEELSKPRTLPFLGRTQPALTGQESTEEIAGKSLRYGADIASLLVAPEAGAETLAGRMAYGAKLGASQFGILGAVGAGGAAIEKGVTPPQVAGQAALGGLTGGISGGVTSGLAPVVAFGGSALARGALGIYNRLTTPIEERVSNVLNETINKGFKPLASSIDTAAKETRYRSNLQTGMRIVNEFKANLGEPGEEALRNPQTRQEVKAAAEQVMDRVFNIYDRQQQIATGQGVRVSLDSAANALESAAKDSFLKTNNPALADKLEERAAQYRKVGSLSPEEAQTWIKNFNSQLNAFYRNPTPNEVSEAAINAAVINHLRETMDSAIEGTTGAEYQGWKNIYGSLKTLQKEAARGAALDARRGAKGFFDISDIYTAGELARGLVTLNPADFVKGGAGFALKQYYKYLNNPNTYIKRAFDALEKTTIKLPETGEFRLPLPAQPALPAGAIPLTAGQDISGVRAAIPTKTFGREPTTGAFKRVYQQTELPPKAEAPAVGAGTKPPIPPNVIDKKSLLYKTNQLLRNRMGLSAQDVTEGLGIDTAGKIRGAKGLTADQIMMKHPDINLKRDVPITDIHGNKSVIPEGEALTPYELKGNKVLLQDGETYVVSKNQFQNIKGNAFSTQMKEFAPELKQTKETILGGDNSQTGQLPRGWKVEKMDKETADNMGANEGDWLLVDESGGDVAPLGAHPNEASAMRAGISSAGAAGADLKQFGGKNPDTKFSQYQLPGGKNYKEILIKAPQGGIGEHAKLQGELDKFLTRGNLTTEEIVQKNRLIDKLNVLESEPTFQSSHWDEPNVLAHLRLNERTYNGKKVTFMEEMQSDWAREARKAGSTVPQNPLLKNWQELSIKRALKEAVDNGSDYLAWTTGEQQAARYNLSTQLESIKWDKPTDLLQKSSKVKSVELKAIGRTRGEDMKITVDENGKVVETLRSAPSEWKGKQLGDVIGKGISEKILAEPKGNLSGEGLNIGGEWAKNLYDRQVKNIVEDITGHKVEVIDMGIPEGGRNKLWKQSNGSDLYPQAVRVGKRIEDAESGKEYVIAKISGNKMGVVRMSDTLTADEVRARSKQGYKKVASEKYFEKDLYYHPNLLETYDISTKKSAGQQAIKITPEIRALVKGESPQLKKPSGRVPIETLGLLPFAATVAYKRTPVEVGRERR